MPACGIIAMSVTAVKRWKCITPTKKCSYFVSVNCIATDGKKVSVFGCNSEEETCGGCCRDMQNYKLRR